MRFAYMFGPTTEWLNGESINWRFRFMHKCLLWSHHLWPANGDMSFDIIISHNSKHMYADQASDRFN
jgi:hypothetical protein